MYAKHFVRYDPFADGTLDGDMMACRRTIEVEGELCAVQIEDLSLAPLRRRDPGFRADIFRQVLKNADGIVLLYDITDRESYDRITEQGLQQVYQSRKTRRGDGQRYPGGRQRFGGILVGNKLDLVRGVEGREVRKELAAEWATMAGFKSYELDTFNREAVEEAVRGLLRNIKRAESRDAEDFQLGEAERLGAMTKGKGKEPMPHATISNAAEKTGLSGTFSKMRRAISHARSKSRMPE